MELSFAAPSTVTSGALVVGATEGSKFLPSAISLDKATQGALTRAMRASRFTGKSGQLLEVLAPVGVKASRIIAVGLGKADSCDAGRVETAAAGAIARAGNSSDTEMAFQLDVPQGSKLRAGELAAHVAFAARLKTYSFTRYRTKNLDEHEQRLKTIRVHTKDVAAARRAFQALDSIATGIALARDLVNEPPNILSPVEFARRTKATLSKAGVKVDVLGENEMKKLGMGALLGVGQGSERESQLVVMQWLGGRKKDEPVALVGKGVCFDSGGLSLKPAGSMMGMKGDMGGAAAVTGTLLALATRKARANVVGIVGLVENMPSGSAQRPDDVVKTMSGQTVEVLNTDAEGRLVLADALTYVQQKFKPKIVIDLATLTGAILVALGQEHAGLFSNDDKLAERLSESGKAVGELVWRLPLGPGYDKALRSKIADMKNIGGPQAGSITAAQFLQRFVEKTPWAHLDIAGVAWQDGEQRPLIPSWGTGWGVRILNQLIERHYER
jgi:leucyl aminopeptidase